MKEILRRAMHPLAVVLGGYFVAKEGTAFCRFLTWIYGDDEKAAQE